MIFIEEKKDISFSCRISRKECQMRCLSQNATLLLYFFVALAYCYVCSLAKSLHFLPKKMVPYGLAPG